MHRRINQVTSFCFVYGRHINFNFTLLCFFAFQVNNIKWHRIPHNVIIKWEESSKMNALHWTLNKSVPCVEAFVAVNYNSKIFLLFECSSTTIKVKQLMGEQNVIPCVYCYNICHHWCSFPYFRYVFTHFYIFKYFCYLWNSPS